MATRFSVSLVVGLLTCGVSAGDVFAGWGSWGGSYGSNGSSGGYGSSGGSYGSYGGNGSWGGGYASSGGSSGGWGNQHAYGPLRGLFAHWHARKMARHAARYASYGSSGGSWGGNWGSSGGSYGGSSGGWGSSGYGSSGGSSGTWTSSDCEGCDGGVGGVEVMDGTTIVPGETTAPEMKSEPMDPATPPNETRRPVRKGVLSVSVPSEAQVLVNGIATTSSGVQRRYVSHGLKPGETYRYVVKAVIERDGQLQTQTKVATLRAGRTTKLDFDFDGTNAVETSLTLSVPDDAKVYLSGHKTQATGNQRRFSTTRIEEGQKWADYLVRVTVDRDGRTLTKEQRVTLNGGDQTSLDFRFDQTELADAR